MSWFGIGKEISEPIKAIGDGLDKLFTSDKERADGDFKIQNLKQQLLLVQAEINRVNAGSFYHSGWRAAAGWVCVSGLFYSSIIAPIVEQTLLLKAPEIHTGLLVNLLLGLLGLAGIRTYEKKTGVAKK